MFLSGISNQFEFNSIYYALIWAWEKSLLHAQTEQTKKQTDP